MIPIRSHHPLPRGTRTYDLHARIGGEEFAILLPGADADAGPRIAERVRHEVSRMGLTIRGATRVSSLPLLSNTMPST